MGRPFKTLLAAFQLNNLTLAQTEFDGKDFDQERILSQIRRILTRHDMNREESLLLFNLGIHYSVSLNFTTYQKLIDSVIRLLQRGEDGVSPSYKGKAVWKTSTAIEKEKVGKYFGGLNRTSWRFHTYQVSERHLKRSLGRATSFPALGTRL